MCGLRLTGEESGVEKESEGCLRKGAREVVVTRFE